jgi:hypothetical protein
VLAGMAAGHSNVWKDAVVALGFRVRPAAAGQVYHLAMVDPTVRHAVHELARRIGDPVRMIRASIRCVGRSTRIGECLGDRSPDPGQPAPTRLR